MTTKEEYARGKKVKVSVTDLTKCYDELLVLDDINFDIYDGELLCIVGPTGCGKTTFLNTLARFIPATKGDILVDGVPSDPRRHNIAFAPAFNNRRQRNIHIIAHFLGQGFGPGFQTRHSHAQIIALGGNRV